jgi:hypothetical protein
MVIRRVAPWSRFPERDLPLKMKTESPERGLRKLSNQKIEDAMVAALFVDNNPVHPAVFVGQENEVPMGPP